MVPPESQKYPGLFFSVPGDEKKFGGCLSAGRGFVHISVSGDLEPCSFFRLIQAYPNTALCFAGRSTGGNRFCRCIQCYPVPIFLLGKFYPKQYTPMYCRNQLSSHIHTIQQRY